MGICLDIAPGKSVPILGYLFPDNVSGYLGNTTVTSLLQLFEQGSLADAGSPGDDKEIRFVNHSYRFNAVWINSASPLSVSLVTFLNLERKGSGALATM